MVGNLSLRFGYYGTVVARCPRYLGFVPGFWQLNCENDAAIGRYYSIGSCVRMLDVLSGGVAGEQKWVKRGNVRAAPQRC